MPNNPLHLKKKSQINLRSEFWASPPESLFDRHYVAAAISCSVGLLEQQAVHGGGIPYLKLGRKCLYRKQDVLDWIAQKSIKATSTAEYQAKEGCV